MRFVVFLQNLSKLLLVKPNIADRVSICIGNGIINDKNDCKISHKQFESLTNLIDKL